MKTHILMFLLAQVDTVRETNEKNVHFQIFCERKMNLLDVGVFVGMAVYQRICNDYSILNTSLCWGNKSYFNCLNCWVSPRGGEGRADAADTSWDPLRAGTLLSIRNLLLSELSVYRGDFSFTEFSV